MPFPIPSSQNLQIPKKKQYQSPFKSSSSKECVPSATKRTERHREREKETKLLKLKAGLCSILLFLDVQSPKQNFLGLTNASLFVVSLCGVLVFVYKRQKKNTEEEEEKKGRSFFFERRPKP